MNDTFIADKRQLNPLTPRVKPWALQSFLTFDSMDRTLKCDHSLNAVDQYFTVVLFQFNPVCKSGVNGLWLPVIHLSQVHCFENCTANFSWGENTDHKELCLFFDSLLNGKWWSWHVKWSPAVDINIRSTTLDHWTIFLWRDLQL